MFVPDFRTLAHDLSAARRSARARRRPRRGGFAPQLLALETRALLSVLTVTNDNDSGTGSLRAQLAAAGPGATIDFAPSVYGTITLTSGPLQVATGVDIQGPGAKNVTVSGDHASTVFDIQSGVTATISGLTITDGLFDLSTGSGGGGIANYGNLTLSRCVVTGNTVASGAGKYGFAQGGAIMSDGPVTITGSTISDNSAPSGGGIWCFNAPVAITASTVAGNSGGGISSFLGDVTVNDCTVSGNTEGGINIGAYGGPGATIPTLTVSGSVIEDNSSTAGGGINAGSAAVEISGSVIADNTAAASGGGINFQPPPEIYPAPKGYSLTITGTTFRGNEVVSTNGNYEVYGGAIRAVDFASVSMSDSSFVENSAVSYYGAQGGALDLEGVDPSTITGCQFIGNQVVALPTANEGIDADGGAIANMAGYGPGVLTISNSSFTNNSALAQGSSGFGEGGAIINLFSPAELTLSSDVFLGNTAVGGPTATSGSGNRGGYGAGGALINLADATATVSDSTFLDNTASGGSASGAGNTGGYGVGGGIQNVSATMTVTDSTLMGNTAVGGAGTDGATGGIGQGGGIQDTGNSYEPGTLRFSGGRIVGNRAIGGAGGGESEGGGAAVTVSGSGSGANASFTDALIALNAAIGGSGGGKGYGGGLYIGTGALTTLTKTKVVGNFASTAGNNVYGSVTGG